MLGMGWFEIFIIVIVALLVIGPDKLPEVARGLAKGVRQVQRLISEVRDTIDLEEYDHQIRQNVDPHLTRPRNASDHVGTSGAHPDFAQWDSDIAVSEDPPKPPEKHSQQRAQGNDAPDKKDAAYKKDEASHKKEGEAGDRKT